MIDAALLEEAKCYLCLGVSLSEALKMALLARIAAAEGGGGTSCFQCSEGDGAPVAAPENVNQPAQYQDTTNDFQYNWNIGAQAWVPVPKKYVALLTQSGTNAPVAVVLENTLGGIVVWTRSDVGSYSGTLVAAFPDNKVALSHANASGTDSEATGQVNVLSKPNSQSNRVDLTTGSNSALEDSILGTDYTIEILVYP